MLDAEKERWFMSDMERDDLDKDVTYLWLKLDQVKKARSTITLSVEICYIFNSGRSELCSMPRSGLCRIRNAGSGLC